MNLDDIRENINLVDDKIVALLEERMILVSKVSEFKKSTGKATLDEGREQAILSRVNDGVQNKQYAPFIVNNFIDIMKQSRDYQESLK